MKFEEFKQKVRKVPIFSGDLAKIWSTDPQVLRNQLQRWKKRGLIIGLRRGLYALNNGDRQVTLSRELIAATLYQPSYISLETALSYYKLIPERVVPIISVTSRKTKSFENQEGLFLYRHLKQEAFFGFLQLRDPAGFPYFLAEPEKALIDYLYFNLKQAGDDLSVFLRGSLRLQNEKRINRRKLSVYADRCRNAKLSRLVRSWK